MDIVERLRQRKERIIAANPSGIISMADSDALEAADEIERLREEIKGITGHGVKQMEEIERLREALQEAVEDGVGWYDKARAALKGDE